MARTRSFRKRRCRTVTQQTAVQWTHHDVNVPIARFLKSRLSQRKLAFYVLRIRFNGSPATKIGITDAVLSKRLSDHRDKPHYADIHVHSVHTLDGVNGADYTFHDVVRRTETLLWRTLRNRGLLLLPEVPGKRTLKTKDVVREHEVVSRSNEASALRVLRELMCAAATQTAVAMVRS